MNRALSFDDRKRRARYGRRYMWGLLPVALAAWAMLVPVKPACATLVIKITPGPGAGQTTWTFSGSATAGGDSTNSIFEDANTIGTNDFWADLGNFTSADDLFKGTVSSTAQVTVGTTTRGIDGVWIDHDAASDDIAISVDGTGDLPIASGSVVSWTGSLVVDLPITDLDETLLPHTFSTSDYDGNNGGLTLNLQVQIVPEPAAILLMLVPGVACVCVQGFRIHRSRRRQKLH